jgi:hypothetical protein
LRAIADPARLDRMWFARADVQRRGMLDRLGRGPASVSELAAPVGMALPLAVKHPAVLDRGGCVASRRPDCVRTCTAQARALDAMETPGRRAQDAAQRTVRPARHGAPR